MHARGLDRPALVVRSLQTIPRDPTVVIAFGGFKADYSSLFVVDGFTLIPLKGV